MARPEKQQTARVVGVKKVKFTKNGKEVEKEIYLMTLDENKDERYYFEVFQSKYFEAKLNEVFIPSLIVDKRPYNDKKTGEARNRCEVMINWEKVG